jgi:voltage-gated potassium channel Kch
MPGADTEKPPPRRDILGIVLGITASVIAGAVLTMLTTGTGKIITSGETQATLTVTVANLGNTLRESNARLADTVKDANARSAELSRRLDTIIQQFAGLYTRAEAVADRQAQAAQIDALSRRIDRLETAVQQQGRDGRR